MIIHIISTALSPITHMHGTAGNVALLQREAVIDAFGKVCSVPCLSGNALRHALVRVPAARFMCETVGMQPMCYQLADLLFHGGRLTKANPLTASGTKDLLKCVPFLALLGGALPGQILQGCLKVSRGLLICKEAADIIERRSGVRISGVGGAESYVGSYLYTRGAEENNPEAIADRMIYEGECVRAGAKFYHTITVESDEPLVIGCLLKALTDASKDIGGMGRIGHGELHLEWFCDEIDDAQHYIGMYTQYLRASASAVVDALSQLFGNAEQPDAEDKKPAKKASKKASKKHAELAAAETEQDAFGELPEA